ncbi:hypothetical protein BT96DRAFT_981210 [Gymnopus androsaceus JB14]|uniref:DUF6534 domain-containing protein n=1 Tax=Gymnopus androsaceus JB14 TaxID=1447944 RepID=A0A6A4GQ88_9AGAR|nr:hypothetical protein BT96DRAFT_981210 [Gymnopus androsaceus JB14]
MSTLDVTIGALQIAVLVAVYQFGIVCVQIFLFFRNFPKENIVTKCLVGLTALTLIGEMISVTDFIYTLTIKGYGNIKFLSKPPELPASTIFCGTTGCVLVQILFVMRVQRLSKLPGWVFIPFWVLITVRESLLAAVAGLMAQSGSLDAFLEKYSWLLTSILVLAMVLDIALSASLGTLLFRERRNTPVARTAAMLERIIMYSLGTGLLPSVGSIAVVIAFRTMPHNLIWAAMYLNLPMAYANCGLLLLNSRADMSKPGSNVITGSNILSLNSVSVGGTATITASAYDNKSFSKVVETHTDHGYSGMNDYSGGQSV